MKRAILNAVATAAVLLTTAGTSQAYVQNFSCWADVSAGLCDSSGNHTLVEARAMKSNAAAQQICAFMLDNGYLLVPWNDGGANCGYNTTFKRSCFSGTSSATRKGRFGGSGHWILDARVATSSDTNC